MQLSTIMSRARFFTLGNSTDTSYSDTDLKASLNEHLHFLNEIAIQASNLSLAFGELVKIDTVAGQNEYLLTDTDVNLKKTHTIWIRRSTTDNYAISTPIKPKSIPDITDYKPANKSHFFLEDSIFIYYDTAIAEVSEGIIILCQTDATELSDSTDVPQLPEFSVRYLILGAKADFMEATNQYDIANNCRAQMELLIPRIKKSYNTRDNNIIKISRHYRPFK